MGYSEKEKEILNAAKECFARYGYEKTTLDDIDLLDRLSRHVQRGIRASLTVEAAATAQRIAHLHTVDDGEHGRHVSDLLVGHRDGVEYICVQDTGADFIPDV